MMRTVEESSQRAVVITFWILLATVVCWILSLPVFPSQDVPVHLYYVQIFGRLLHHATLYNGSFAIRSLFSVYALYYYLLLGLTTFLSPVLADKIVVALIVVLFACGFRMLARLLGQAGNLASLFIFPVIISWPLGMGFHSFCLSAALGMFALAEWFRMARVGAGWRTSLAFLGLLALMMITHPVPLLLVLALAGCELAMRVAALSGLSLSARFQAVRISLVLFCVGCCTLFFVLRFTDKSRVSSNVVATAHSSIAERVLRLGLLRTFCLYSGSDVPIVAYRFALYMILVGAVIFAFRAWSYKRSITNRLALRFWLGMVLLLGIGLPFIPEKMNGSAFFADRLVMFVWVAALAAASCAALPLGWLRRGLVAAACIILVLTLGEGELYIRPAAYRAALMENIEPYMLPGLQGLGLPAQVAFNPPHLAFNPYLWQQARFFRRENAILLNAPWLDLPILPLKAGPDLLTGELPQIVLDEPFYIKDQLAQITTLRFASQQRPVQFILYVKVLPPLETDQASLQRIRNKPAWNCHETDIYLLCRPHDEASQQSD